jgi:hypothetical protein
MERKRVRKQRRQSYDAPGSRSGRRKSGGGGGGEGKLSYAGGSGVELSSIRNGTMFMDSEHPQSSGRSGGESSDGIRFSEVFNIHNPSHLMAVSNLMMEDPGVMARFFSRYKSEPGGLVGLHSVVTRRLAEAYLREHLEEEEEEAEEEEMLGSGGGSHHYLSSKNPASDDKFMKL